MTPERRRQISIIETPASAGQRTEGRERRTEDHQRLLGICKEIGKMLGKMMNEPEKWCARFRPL